MYKCLCCGHVFNDGEQAKWTEAHGEKLDGCPVCHGGYGEATKCKVCGDAFVDGELFDGICTSCLDDSITYDRALEFFESEDGVLEDFMFSKMFNGAEIGKTSPTLHKVLHEWFLRIKADNILRGSLELLNKCREYILEDDGDYGKGCYAEWLNWRR